MPYRLEARRVTKAFPGVVALDDVSLGVRAAAVHAVVGENGAGKSTLMNILSGVYRPDRGDLLLDNQPVTFASPRAAEQAGVVIIHQELNLVPALSVAENIFLGREPLRAGLIDRRTMEQHAAALLGRLGHPLDPRRIVESLKVSDRQMVEIAKALSLDASVLVMDEPTTALAAGDVDRLFGLIRTLTGAGTAVVYISHKMDELFRIANEFTVLRDGRWIGHRAASETTPSELVRMMVGRDVTHARAATPRPEHHEVLRVEHLSSAQPGASGRRRLYDISFHVRAGEVLGVAGLMGAGRTELLEALFGVHAVSSDSHIAIEGRPTRIADPRRAVQAGMAFVSEDRAAQGLVPGLDVRGNITLAALQQFSRAGFLSGAREAMGARECVQRFGIKTPDIRTSTNALSGGNQQKVVLARWLLTTPRVLLLDEPTKGIDIKGKTDIYRVIDELAASGLGIVLVSSELPELLALSDRILVLRDGRVAGMLDRADATEERVIELATIADESAAVVA